MSDRSRIMAIYRQWLIDRWADKRLTLDEIRALKVFCEVNQIMPDEHEATVNEVGIDPAELLDEHNQLPTDWLRARREVRPAGSGALRFAPRPTAPWRKQLPDPPLSWQNALAGVGAVVALIALIVAFVAR